MTRLLLHENVKCTYENPTNVMYDLWEQLLWGPRASQNTGLCLFPPAAEKSTYKQGYHIPQSRSSLEKTLRKTFLLFTTSQLERR